MSELKAMTAYDAYWKAASNGDTGILVYLKSEADKVIAHANYKRCLAMARWCESEAYIHEHGSEYDEDLVAWFGEWHKRWLKLAEKFKEA